MDETLKRTTFIIGHNGDWKASVDAILDAARLDTGDKKRVLLKPNLVEAMAPPVTTPVELVEALVDGLRERLPGVEIIIGEGCGAASYDTPHAFDELGYTKMAKRRNVGLVDLNKEPLRKLSNPELTRWPEFYLPDILFDSFIISVPVLKAHSLAGVTLTMKNMMGAVPPLHYRAGGHWKKSAFHSMMQESVLDLNMHRTPDFTVIDATIGMSEAHLWGPHCDPKPGIIIAGYDPVMTDAYGAKVLKRRWQDIGHIRDADGRLGHVKPLSVKEL
ncbi:MAG: DUF362 domain-containing protein [Deltaproteobacteria bacterium]|nr:DUF362 domain-containing protein [Deltaproteobacteria bacterium]